MKDCINAFTKSIVKEDIALKIEQLEKLQEKIRRPDGSIPRGYSLQGIIKRRKQIIKEIDEIQIC